MLYPKVLIAAILAIVAAQNFVNDQTALDGALTDSNMRVVAGVDGVPEDDDVLPEGSSWSIKRSVNMNMTAMHEPKSPKAKTNAGGRLGMEIMTLGSALVVAAAVL